MGPNDYSPLQATMFVPWRIYGLQTSSNRDRIEVMHIVGFQHAARACVGAGMKPAHYPPHGLEISPYQASLSSVKSMGIGTWLGELRAAWELPSA